MDGAPRHPPPATTVRFLAIFHRAFAMMGNLGVPLDLEKLELSGEIADALHNVPSAIWNYNDRRSARLRPWLDDGFLRCLGRAPAEIRALAHAIFLPDRDAELLGLAPDLRDFRLPPPPTLSERLDHLYVACLAIRGLRGCAGRACYGDDRPAWEVAPRQLEVCLMLVNRLASTPSQLVRWPPSEDLG